MEFDEPTSPSIRFLTAPWRNGRWALVWLVICSAGLVLTVPPLTRDVYALAAGAPTASDAAPSLGSVVVLGLIVLLALAGGIYALVSLLAEYWTMGAAPLAILLLAVGAAAALLVYPTSKSTADLRVWTFAKEHAAAYKLAVGSFEKQHPGVKAEVQFVHGDAVTTRLRAAFWADQDVPELVEVEISSAGSFFRGPIDDLGFLDLTPMLIEAGLYNPQAPQNSGLVHTRFAPYTYKGRIFGMPHDVHPVMLAYRADLFAQLGVNADELDTWDKFVAAAKKVCVRSGDKVRYMIGLNPSGADSFEVLLFQRGGGYFDKDGQCTMDSGIAAKTMLWLIPLVAGPERIGADVSWGPAFTRNLMEERILCVICPDWRSKSIEKDMPRLSGKMKLMPLPAFADDPVQRRTSTWGGTMIGVTRKAKDPKLAFDLARFLYLDRPDGDPEELPRRFRDLNILPPQREVWKRPVFDEPREFWCGQPLGRLYANLADQVPAQYTSPFIVLAKAKMGEVVAACAVYYSDHGEDGFEAYVRQKLKSAADAVKVQMKRNPF